MGIGRPRLGRPFEVVLPSGARTTLTLQRTDPPARDLDAALENKAVSSSIDPRTLPLADAHVVEALAAALGAIASRPVELTCRNCAAVVSIDAAAALPLDPLLRPEGDPELDAPIAIDAVHPLPSPIPIARRRRANRFRLRPRTLADRVRLERVLGDDPTAPLPLDAPLIRAVGLVLLEDDATAIGSPIAIARALSALDEDAFERAWAAIVDAWDAAHYPRRLLAPAACPRCGARHDLEVLPRPLGGLDLPRAGHGFPEFPALPAFRARAEAIARAVIEEAGADASHGLEVLVDDEVPPCDDGGEPLLGSYTPSPDADGDVLRPATSPFTIALYYRTFRAMYDDEPYDVDAEIRETLAHELEHHVGFLRGDDPLDDEERAAIDREHARVHGRRTGAARLASDVGWLAGDVGRFVRATWPLWLLVVVATVVILASTR